MKRWILVGCALLWAAGAYAADGKALFDNNGCAMCHHAEKKGAGPSVQEIAKAYSGKKADLESYLAGKAEPTVEPSKAHMMKHSLEKIEAMSADDRGALADYMLGQK
jgi:cytochrome c